MSRRLSREYIVQFLFSADFNQNENEHELLENFFSSIEDLGEEDAVASIKENDKKFAVEIIEGTLEKLDEIDAAIEKSALDWKRERIAKVDLAILRLAIYEILFRDDIPDSVTANEAIELAKKFSTEESSSFINGIIGKIIRDKAQ